MLLLGVNADKTERNCLRNSAASAAGQFADSFDYEAIWSSHREEYAQNLRDIEQAGLCCIAVNGGEDVKLCISSREAFAEALMLIVADPSLPPTLYMRPDIMAGHLLLKPVAADDARSAFLALYRHYSRSAAGGKAPDRGFVIQRKDTVIRIPYEAITYFEAREKKVFACTAQKQTAFYSTLDKLESELPKQFSRCHKSYIVNRDAVESVSVADGLIKVPGGTVPVSRSYRSLIAEMKS